ncbi:MAG: methyltransferase domain-containing protein, partial [Anaerolineales bacterium]
KALGRHFEQVRARAHVCVPSANLVQLGEVEEQRTQDHAVQEAIAGALPFHLQSLLPMKPLLESLLVCPHCKQPFSIRKEHLWRCAQDGREVPLQEGKPIFTSTPQNAHIFERIERGPNQGTPWRRANWKFLQQQVHRQPDEAIILDVGAGHGDFAALFAGRNYLSLDIVPYPEIDLVCDLTECIPFRENTFDMIVLMNVLEHVYRFHELLAACSYLLKPGGVLVIAVPFLLKVHQIPFDFYRYTHYALEEMARQHGFEIVLLEGYYDPLFLLGEGIRNLRFWVLPGLLPPLRWLARGLLLLNEGLLTLLRLPIGKGTTQAPHAAKSPAPVGYHLVWRKPS